MYDFKVTKISIETNGEIVEQYIKTVEFDEGLREYFNPQNHISLSTNFADLGCNCKIKTLHRFTLGHTPCDNCARLYVYINNNAPDKFIIQLLQKSLIGLIFTENHRYYYLELNSVDALNHIISNPMTSERYDIVLGSVRLEIYSKMKMFYHFILIGGVYRGKIGCNFADPLSILSQESGQCSLNNDPIGEIERKLLSVKIIYKRNGKTRGLDLGEIYCMSSDYERYDFTITFGDDSYEHPSKYGDSLFELIMCDVLDKHTARSRIKRAQ